jgi:hypothetical protein
MKKPVTKDEWKLHRMPSLHATIPINRQFSTKEITLIKVGFRPETMDDRWIIFYEEDRLYVHRSWTGYCTYVVHFKKQGREHVAYELQANRNAEQYGLSDDAYDIRMAFWLIDYFLLKHETEMPVSNS